MDVATPDWASSKSDSDSARAEEESRPVLQGASAAEMEMTSTALSTEGSELAPSSERSFLHRVYRFFKFITISLSLLLLIAQIVSVAFLPFDGVELVLKIFLSTFSALIILNELEWWGMLRDSPMFWNWIPRGYFYAFIGMVSIEENNLKPSTSTLSSLPVDYSADLFIETSSWMMFSIGIIYLTLGLCCGQRYVSHVREDYKNRLAQRRRIFERGLSSDTAFS